MTTKGVSNVTTSLKITAADCPNDFPNLTMYKTLTQADMDHMKQNYGYHCLLACGHLLIN